MAKNYPVCAPWEEPKPQAQKLVDGEGSSLADGLSASVPMFGEECYKDGRHEGFGPRPYRKTEKPA